ncbi:solute carrier family 22 member 18 [Hippocampus zosterae]|uniref:solute carrier family 22 member 18 n=1 Tax=Hippocampus zosterae TaxID=109293 RepID=UPI00223CA0F8|nr:solute carrier family 22 member 18 [Hippocampus zosterae]
MTARVENSDLTSPVSFKANAATHLKKKTTIYAVYVIAALDITWMFLQFSITPFLARKLGFDTLWFGYLQTTVGVMQLVGGPLFGRFADVLGARAAMSLACTANIVFFILLAIADSPVMLFVHKLPTIVMHILPASQMVVSDLSEPEKRADGLSKLGLCFGIGMIAGSTVGGHLVKSYGETFAACSGAAGSSFSLLLVLSFIPRTTKVQSPASKTDSETKSKSIFDVGQITRLMKFPGVTPTFVVKIVSSLPSGIFQVMFSIITLDFFKLTPEQNGYIMAYFGVAQMVVQGGVIGRLTSRYSESSLLLLSVGISAFVGLAQAYMQNVFHFCLTVVPMILSLSIFNVITDSLLTKSVPPSDTGTMLGLCASVQSLLRTVGPTIGGFLYVNYGIFSIGFLQFIVNSSVLAYLLKRRLNKKDGYKE